MDFGSAGPMALFPNFKSGSGTVFPLSLHLFGLVAGRFLYVSEDSLYRTMAASRQLSAVFFGVARKLHAGASAFMDLERTVPFLLGGLVRMHSRFPDNTVLRFARPVSLV